MIAVRFSRTQWAVGQGFFHSGVVRIGQRQVTYVYDCGSLDTGGGKAARIAEIDMFTRRHPRGVGMLYLSHFHYDHVSGVEELFSKTLVRRVTIPLVPAAERLMAFGSAISSGVNVSQWYQDLIVDPERAIRSLRGEVEVFLFRPEEQTDEPGLDHRDQDANIEEDGTAVVYGPATTFGVGNGRGRFIPLWVWDPFVLKFSGKKLTAFLAKLAEKLDMSVPRLKTVIEDKDFVRHLVEKHEEELTVAFGSSFPDMNLSSLCLYSGPASEVVDHGNFNRTKARHCKREGLAVWNFQPAWLGTGDGHIGIQGSKELERRYKNVLKVVGTLALPHHGAATSFDSSLLSRVGVSKPTCVVSVGTGNTYEHPHHTVVQAVASSGCHFVAVTEAEESRWTESGVGRFK